MRQESRLLDSLINEVVVSVALEVHGRAKRAKMDCLLCDQPYVQNVSDFSEPTHGKFFAYFNEAGDSATYVNGTKTDYYSNNPLFECLVCSRQVSSNRYATHLEKCMGIGNKSVRKSSIRNAKSMSSAATQRLLHTNSRSASPATSASSQPRKQRTASPAPSKEMPVKGDQRASTPLAKQVDVVSKPTTTAPTKAESTKTKDKSIPPKLSASAAPVSTSSTPATSTPAQADEDAMFDDADFPSGFDLSSDSDDVDGVDDSGAAPAAGDDTVDDIEFDLDEEGGSENDVDLDVDVMGSDDVEEEEEQEVVEHDDDDDEDEDDDDDMSV